MAGGTWTTQNKVRPGVYINFESEPRPLGSVGERGIVAMALVLGWGEVKKLTRIAAGEDVQHKLGYSLAAPELKLVRESLKRAQTLLLYRLNEGTKAVANLGDLTFTAKYSGVRGNDLVVRVQADVDTTDAFVVTTLLDGTAVDTQTVTSAEALLDNEWIVFGGEGVLEPIAGLPLAGGTNGTVTNSDHTAYLETVELQEFHTMAVTITDPQLKSVYASFASRLREQEGKKIQVVLSDYPTADHEGVVSVKNGVVLSDGSVIPAAEATAWVAGAIAGSQPNESLTYQGYDDAVDVDTRYTNTQIESALRNGEFLFTPSHGRAVVEQDINTLRSFTPSKGKAYGKNRVIRVLDGINNDFKRIFETFFLGKVDNTADGRNLLRNECNAYLTNLLELGAIQNFDAQTDVIVEPGVDSDAVVMSVYVQPVDAVEKIYMKVQVR
ncbi:phage tail sheath family protein [Paenibacillus daejeonensis]|uniref:phage tail sheath family protein n=1 Tax=Paenibacillus daejeonensis TaxID=135193 RepID=UPI00036CDC80|nr:phage tail sheath family protein [Paenibacillus daejeonensis]